MSTILRLGEQVVFCDREATLALYRDAITMAGADNCGCFYCSNFAAQRSRLYPDVFLRLLNELGVDPAKELEAFDYEFANRQNTYSLWRLVRILRRNTRRNGLASLAKTAIGFRVLVHNEVSHGRFAGGHRAVRG